MIFKFYHHSIIHFKIVKKLELPETAWGTKQVMHKKLFIEILKNYFAWDLIEATPSPPPEAYLYCQFSEPVWEKSAAGVQFAEGRRRRSFPHGTQPCGSNTYNITTAGHATTLPRQIVFWATKLLVIALCCSYSI